MRGQEIWLVARPKGGATVRFRVLGLYFDAGLDKVAGLGLWAAATFSHVHQGRLHTQSNVDAPGTKSMTWHQKGNALLCSGCVTMLRLVRIITTDAGAAPALPNAVNSDPAQALKLRLPARRCLEKISSDKLFLGFLLAALTATPSANLPLLCLRMGNALDAKLWEYGSVLRVSAEPSRPNGTPSGKLQHGRIKFEASSDGNQGCSSGELCGRCSKQPSHVRVEECNNRRNTPRTLPTFA